MSVATSKLRYSSLKVVVTKALTNRGEGSRYWKKVQKLVVSELVHVE